MYGIVSGSEFDRISPENRLTRDKIGAVDDNLNAL